MATYNTSKPGSISSDFPRVVCDICGSDDIADTTEGYVCRTCGIVLEIQKLHYDRPYNADLVQYAKGLGHTQIGNKRERMISPNSGSLKRLSKYNNVREHAKVVVEKSVREISRILSMLGLGENLSLRKSVIDKFCKIRPRLHPGSKFRNTEKLTAMILYFCSKVRKVPINPAQLVEISQLSKKEFNAFLFQVTRFFPEYSTYQRQEWNTSI
jgi:transcription initiation factor TFIIIB Brf1 subunit/transcription initiation factor TFIIB